MGWSCASRLITFFEVCCSNCCIFTICFQHLHKMRRQDYSNRYTIFQDRYSIRWSGKSTPHTLLIYFIAFVVISSWTAGMKIVHVFDFFAVLVHKVILLPSGDVCCPFLVWQGFIFSGCWKGINTWIHTCTINAFILFTFSFLHLKMPDLFDPVMLRLIPPSVS